MFKQKHIVLLKNTEYSIYLKWYFGRIVQITSGKDKIVRVVKIKDKIDIHKRAVLRITELSFVD